MGSGEARRGSGPWLVEVGLRADGPPPGTAPAAADLLVDPDSLAWSHRRLQRAATERRAQGWQSREAIGRGYGRADAL
ncbi:hypothetical protein BMJ35_17955 [Sinorhizobium medicae]|nr:hypothetical protein BMJ35_17955 [Sinorhizobium medicae]